MANDTNSRDICICGQMFNHHDRNNCISDEAGNNSTKQGKREFWWIMPDNNGQDFHDIVTFEPQDCLWTKLVNAEYAENLENRVEGLVRAIQFSDSVIVDLDRSSDFNEVHMWREYVCELLGIEDLKDLSKGELK